jgi:hypothetical protein
VKQINLNKFFSSSPVLLLVFHLSIAEAMDINKSWGVSFGQCVLVPFEDLLDKNYEWDEKKLIISNNTSFPFIYFFLKYKTIENKNNLGKIGLEYRFYQFTGKPHYQYNPYWGNIYGGGIYGEVRTLLANYEIPQYEYEDVDFSSICHLLSLRINYKNFIFRIGYNFWDEKVKLFNNDKVYTIEASAIDISPSKTKTYPITCACGFTTDDLSIFKWLPKISLNFQHENLVLPTDGKLQPYDFTFGAILGFIGAGVYFTLSEGYLDLSEHSGEVFSSILLGSLIYPILSFSEQNPYHITWSLGIELSF